MDNWTLWTRVTRYDTGLYARVRAIDEFRIRRNSRSAASSQPSGSEEDRATPRGFGNKCCMRFRCSWSSQNRCDMEYPPVALESRWCRRWNQPSDVSSPRQSSHPTETDHRSVSRLEQTSSRIIRNEKYRQPHVPERVVRLRGDMQSGGPQLRLSLGCPISRQLHRHVRLQFFRPLLRQHRGRHR